MRQYGPERVSDDWIAWYIALVVTAAIALVVFAAL